MRNVNSVSKPFATVSGRWNHAPPAMPIPLRGGVSSRVPRQTSASPVHTRACGSWSPRGCTASSKLTAGSAAVGSSAAWSSRRSSAEEPLRPRLGPSACTLGCGVADSEKWNACITSMAAVFTGGTLGRLICKPPTSPALVTHRKPEGEDESSATSETWYRAAVDQGPSPKSG